MPAAYTLHSHFGNYRQLYNAVGYQLPLYDLYHGELAEPALRLRRKLVKRISEIFPKHVGVTSLPSSGRSILEVDHNFMVAVLLCRTDQRGGDKGFGWSSPLLRSVSTLPCFAKSAPTKGALLVITYCRELIFREGLTSLIALIRYYAGVSRAKFVWVLCCSENTHAQGRGDWKSSPSSRANNLAATTRTSMFRETNDSTRCTRRFCSTRSCAAAAVPQSRGIDREGCAAKASGSNQRDYFQCRAIATS